MSRAADLNWLQSFASEASWQFAKTYVESYPHEYTLQRSCDPTDFSKAIRCIERWGVVEPFWSTRRKYLYMDDRKYWHMGDAESEDPVQRPALINRTWLDVTRYRNDALALGYDEPSLNRLVERWKELLARARDSAGAPPRKGRAQSTGEPLAGRSLSNDVRKVVLRRAGGQCEDCGGRLRWHSTHIHHQTYECFGKEHSEDVEVLCIACHGKRHPNHTFLSLIDQRRKAEARRRQGTAAQQAERSLAKARRKLERRRETFYDIAKRHRARLQQAARPFE